MARNEAGSSEESQAEPRGASSSIAPTVRRRGDGRWRDPARSGSERVYFEPPLWYYAIRWSLGLALNLEAQVGTEEAAAARAAFEEAWNAAGAGPARYTAPRP